MSLMMFMMAPLSWNLSSRQTITGRQQCHFKHHLLLFKRGRKRVWF